MRVHAIALGLVGVMTIAVVGYVQERQATPRIRPSQHGSVTQRIADTTITIEYNRPVARGRDLFGALVPWGRVWCPGADECTTIAVSTDIKIGGQDLRQGTYSLWALPEQERWTMIVNRVQPVFHPRYPTGEDVLRIQTTPRTGGQMETLAFYFPVVDGRHAELVLHWGTTIVPLAIDVP